MAKGITQDQVNTAADALVASGERPTVERIRAFLGTGSPNTVTRMLEGWWQSLGGRLTAQQSKIDMPNAPSEVAVAASQLWEHALEAARTQVEATLEAARTALADERATLNTQSEQQEQDAQRQAAAMAAAEQAILVAETRLSDTQRLVDRQADQLADLTRQREDLQKRLALESQVVARLTAQTQTQDETMAAERQSHVEHVKATENRAHIEVDRAREESKSLRQELSGLKREKVVGERLARKEYDAVMGKLGVVELQNVVHRTQLEAQSRELQRLETWNATLKAVTSKSRKPAARLASAKKKPQKPGKAASSSSKKRSITKPKERST